LTPAAAFAGRWSTTFGSLVLEPQGGRITGTYAWRGVEGHLEGRVRGGTLRFAYREPGERGSGEFQLARSGRFFGSYLPQGAKARRRWDGHRGWDGVWETDFGRMRLLHDGRRVHGWYGGALHSTIAGTASEAGLAFRYREKNAAGTGRFRLAADGEGFSGEWRPQNRREWQPWHGRRLHAAPGVRWLVVAEAHWQRHISEPEFSFGGMLREVFARLPGVRVRQRFFHDASTLERWCRELAYVPEPSILLVASHGLAGGLSVHGKLIDTAHVMRSLEHAEALDLLHFSACLVGLDGGKAMARHRFPVSGYTTSVDWGASALLEFTYLDLMLNRGLTPAAAARLLPKLVPYAGNRVLRGLPYRAAGFRFFPAR
jgi:hypothetical protein